MIQPDSTLAKPSFTACCNTMPIPFSGRHPCCWKMLFKNLFYGLIICLLPQHLHDLPLKVRRLLVAGRQSECPNPASGALSIQGFPFPQRGQFVSPKLRNGKKRQKKPWLYTPKTGDVSEKNDHLFPHGRWYECTCFVLAKLLVANILICLCIAFPELERFFLSFFYGKKKL